MSSTSLGRARQEAWFCRAWGRVSRLVNHQLLAAGLAELCPALLGHQSVTICWHAFDDFLLGVEHGKGLAHHIECRLWLTSPNEQINRLVV